MTAARIHLTLAALMGLAGVALLAAGAHVTGTANVLTAGQMLLFHASVIFGGTTARKGGYLADLAARIALSLIILGAALFAADLARRGFANEALFPRAAPTGGFLMLGGWLVLALSALFAKRA
ncbi:MAG TPA: DUF423 domain-containing protein [Bosea sp. (in: a-proteobacteria)]|jgi:uncharacterized membrane protein YgdD (TMEM256/DUF423 family)|uniref:DUF423 domain-containing protein n=1 Tax=Bosea sp. (in: a-proteobacteria) TaxID=1871050 RepID=UPI002E105936|nr:DUF423 domain-containing protein [Bosea sp. (in: a-proteobacteria)]